MSLSGFVVFIVVIGFALISSFVKKKMPENPNLKHNNSDLKNEAESVSSSFDDMLSGLLKNVEVQKENTTCEYAWNDGQYEKTEIKVDSEEIKENTFEDHEIRPVNSIRKNEMTKNSIIDKPSNSEEWRKAIIMHEILKTKF